MHPRIVVLVEGRDGAGKTTLVREIARARAAAIQVMPRPTEDELRGFYFGRHLDALARAASPIVVCDRSWYSRAGLERVMGFCSSRELESFFEAVPRVEAELVRRGTRLVKIYVDVSDAEQARRILRRSCPSALDLASLSRASAYRAAAREMLLRTSTPGAPWHVVKSDSQKEGLWTGRGCSIDFVSSTSAAGSFASRS